MVPTTNFFNRVPSTFHDLAQNRSNECSFQAREGTIHSTNSPPQLPRDSSCRGSIPADPNRRATAMYVEGYNSAGPLDSGIVPVERRDPVPYQDLYVPSNTSSSTAPSPGSKHLQSVRQDSLKIRQPRRKSEERRFCAVCGEKANGNFFNAIVCLPCKSFFIRCTRDGERAIQKLCRGACNVIKKLRHRCQYCRFQRCLAIGMMRREKPEEVVAGEGQELCRVCGDLANGVHFGVFTCEGCKKFFRRGQKEHDSYLCRSKGDCSLNPRNRNHCRRCRYLKCLAVGMSRRAIKMGRPRKCYSVIHRTTAEPLLRIPVSSDQGITNQCPEEKYTVPQQHTQNTDLPESVQCSQNNAQSQWCGLAPSMNECFPNTVSDPRLQKSSDVLEMRPQTLEKSVSSVTEPATALIQGQSVPSSNGVSGVKNVHETSGTANVIFGAAPSSTSGHNRIKPSTNESVDTGSGLHYHNGHTPQRPLQPNSFSSDGQFNFTSAQPSHSTNQPTTLRNGPTTRVDSCLSSSHSTVACTPSCVPVSRQVEHLDSALYGRGHTTTHGCSCCSPDWRRQGLYTPQDSSSARNGHHHDKCPSELATSQENSVCPQENIGKGSTIQGTFEKYIITDARYRPDTENENNGNYALNLCISDTSLSPADQNLHSNNASARLDQCCSFTSIPDVSGSSRLKRNRPETFENIAEETKDAKFRRIENNVTEDVDSKKPLDLSFPKEAKLQQTRESQTKQPERINDTFVFACEKANGRTSAQQSGTTTTREAVFYDTHCSAFGVQRRVQLCPISWQSSQAPHCVNTLRMQNCLRTGVTTMDNCFQCTLQPPLLSCPCQYTLENNGPQQQKRDINTERRPSAEEAACVTSKLEHRMEDDIKSSLGLEQLDKAKKIVLSMPTLKELVDLARETPVSCFLRGNRDADEQTWVLEGLRQKESTEYSHQVIQCVRSRVNAIIAGRKLSTKYVRVLDALLKSFELLFMACGKPQSQTASQRV